jgi:hypothetical protein
VRRRRRFRMPSGRRLRDLERLLEALRHGVIVRIAAPAHRANQAVTKRGFPITMSRVLRTAIAVMDATWRRPSPLDCAVKRGKRQANVDRAADCIADHPSRPSVEDHRNIDKAIDHRDVLRVRRASGEWSSTQSGGSHSSALSCAINTKWHLRRSRTRSGRRTDKSKFVKDQCASARTSGEGCEA